METLVLIVEIVFVSFFLGYRLAKLTPSKRDIDLLREGWENARRAGAARYSQGCLWAIVSFDDFLRKRKENTLNVIDLPADTLKEPESAH